MSIEARDERGAERRRDERSREELLDAGFGPAAETVGPGWIAARRCAAVTVGPVGILGGGPLLVVEDVAAPEPSRVPRLTSTSAHWTDVGRLIVEVAGEVSSDPLDGAPESEVVFALRSPGTGVEHWLPTRTIGPVTDHFAGSTEIDIRSAASGLALPTGVWRLTVGVHGRQSGWSRRIPVPASPVGPGLVDATLVVPVDIEGTLALDVGAARTSAVGAIDPALVTVDDSARGIRITAAVPDLVVAGGADLPGSVHLGDLRLPARLVADGARARVEAYVSGLAGSSPLATRFGVGRAVATGLQVTFDPLGTVSVQQRDQSSGPPPAPAAAPAAVSAPAPPPASSRRAAPATAPAGPPPAITRLRRAVPPRFEPAVAALSRNPLARRLYRTLIPRR